MDVRALLARPDLPLELRHLCAATAAVGPADWDSLRAVLDSARAAGLPRAEFEEMLLQATLFFGFPRVVSAFEVLAAQWPAPAPPTGGGLPADQQHRAGRELFAAIYGRNDAAVRTMLAACHQEFHDFVLEAAYGRILTRPRLPARDRELLAVTALALLDQVPQLVAHARGALAFGAGRQEIEAAIATAVGDPAAAQTLARRALAGP
jgi:4-carboxymuconolactone decarboxylase